MSAPSEEPKPKRRQNVACSCCKLRRIKCDLSDLLNALPSSSTQPPPPLSVLVEQHPEVGCTNCKRKGLKCDTQGIREPTRPNKGGKRIEEAKRKFGEEQQKRQDEQVRNNMGLEPNATEIPFDLMEFLNNQPINPPLNPFQATFLSQDVQTSVNPLETASGPLPDQTINSLFDPTDLQTFNINPDPSPSNPSPLIKTPGPSSSSSQQAASIWQQFANNRKEAMYLVRTTGLTPGADGVQISEEDDDLMGGLQSRLSAYMTEMQAPSPSSTSTTYQGISRLSSSTTPLAVPGNILGINYNTYTNHNDDYLSGDTRKRSRSPYDLDSQSRKMLLVSSNPWRLYSESGSGQMITWGRREAVSEQLADRALGMALSNHLVKVFFQAVHLSYPAISPEVFYLEWIRAGQRSDRMSPAQEALCAVIEAWGARYSDSPVILGLSEAKANAAPKVIKADGTFTPGTRARTHWGTARIGACKALLARAKRLIDEHGLFRMPSVTGVQALTLYSQLMQMTDEKLLDKDYWLQNRMIHSTIIEQMQLLGLMWDAEGPIVTDVGEASVSHSQLQMKQRRLFWSHMIGDAFFSAAIGALPRIPQEDIDAAGEWVETVQDKLPQSAFKLLAFFLSIYHRLGLAGREVATHVAYPLRKKGAADVGKICMTVRKVWKDIRDISRDLNAQVTQQLKACRKEDLLGFSPLNFLANLRLSCPFLLLVIHQLIRDQLAFWKSCQPPSSPAFISTPSDRSSSTTPPSKPGQGNTRAFHNIELLERLNKESIDGLLLSCRSQIHMLKAFLPTGVIQSAAVLLRVLLATAQLLAEVPTNEQGYPDHTPGGHGWTWEAKQKEMDICLEALHQVGWAWADVAEVCDSVALTMERMTPSPEEISAWNSRHQQTTESRSREYVARMKEAEAQASVNAVEAVLTFWPPVSIPNLIEHALQNDPKALLNSISPGMLSNSQQSHVGISKQHTSGPNPGPFWPDRGDQAFINERLNDARHTPFPGAAPGRMGHQNLSGNDWLGSEENSGFHTLSMPSQFLDAHFVQPHQVQQPQQPQPQPTTSPDTLDLDSLLNFGTVGGNNDAETYDGSTNHDGQAVGGDDGQTEQLDIDTFLKELGIPHMS
ncbi:hypothetical protein V865_007718 [Kwoniella europaea PYCC6329]|uniref:Zn(2)-C6 fungal-type domain-containing protein n=1 Tax=Kwoniella europaea PYCC6329 TaxID=1423913 RepID=A0AAX4KT34_9TREE